MRIGPTLTSLALLIALGPVRASAECAVVDDHAEARAIFLGRVLRVERRCPPKLTPGAEPFPHPWGACHNVVHFAIREAWRGVTEATYRVAVQGPEVSDGGLDFRVGERWLVFAFPPPFRTSPGDLPLPPGAPALAATGCSFNTDRVDRKGSRAQAALRSLRRLPKTFPPPKAPGR